jgi:hypothetical protein
MMGSDVGSEVLRAVEKAEQTYQEELHVKVQSQNEKTDSTPPVDVGSWLSDGRPKQQSERMSSGVSSDLRSWREGSREIKTEDEEVGALRFACAMAADRYSEAVEYASAYRKTYTSSVRANDGFPAIARAMLTRLESRASEALTCLTTLESQLEKLTSSPAQSQVTDQSTQASDSQHGYYMFPYLSSQGQKSSNSQGVLPQFLECWKTDIFRSDGSSSFVRNFLEASSSPTSAFTVTDL